MILEISKNILFTEHLLATASVFKMQFLIFFKSKYSKFFPAGSFFLALQLKYLSECPNSEKTPLPSQIPGYTPVLNGLSKGYCTKKSIHKSLVEHSKNHEHATCIDFQFHNLKLSQTGILDFHVNTATADLCMKEVIDSLLRIAL